MCTVDEQTQKKLFAVVKWITGIKNNLFRGFNLFPKGC